MAIVLSRFEVRAVGQGAFIRGQEAIFGEQNGLFPRKVVRWIYDCGTDAACQVIDGSVLDLTASWTADKNIDLLIISHFDKDHISGLPMLLSKYCFDRILMPQVPWLSRIFALLSSLDKADVPLIAELMEFVDDPAAYIRAHRNGQAIVILVEPAEPPGDTIRNANEDLDGDGRGQQTISISDPSSDPPDRSSSRTTASGAPFVWEDAWEMVPYVDAGARSEFFTFADSERKDLNDEFRRILSVARQKPKDAAESNVQRKSVNKALKLLREKLYAAMADSASKKIRAKHKNVISLMAYLGPVRVLASGTSVIRGVAPDSAHSPHRNWEGCVADRSGALLTGDGDLREVEAIQRLRSILTDDRVSSISLFQIPHHGSKANANRLTATMLGGPFNFINANPAGKHGHPDASVVHSFRKVRSMRGALVDAAIVLANARSFETSSFASSTILPADFRWWHDAAVPRW